MAGPWRNSSATRSWPCSGFLASTSDALRAVRAAAGMRQRLVRLNVELRDDLGAEIAARTGINTGGAWPATRTQTLVTGDAVNTAARLEQAAGADKILIGEPTYRLVRDAVVAEPIDPVDAKGKADPVPAFRLDEVIVGRRLTPGDWMLRWWPGCGAANDHRRVRSIGSRSGLPPGHRRRRGGGGEVPPRARGALTGSATARPSCGDDAFPMGRASPTGRSRRPSAERQRNSLTSIRRRRPDTGSRRSSRVSSESDRIVDGVAELIGLGEGARTAEEGFSAVSQFFEGLARTQPLVLVFDDIHWGEETFLDLLGYVVEWTSDVPVLVICLARKELLDRRPGWAAADVVVLASLGDAECESLLRGLLGTEEVPLALTEAIAGAAEGNPLFVEELLAMLIDDGLLVRNDGHWSPTPGLAGLTVPPTVQALLAARLEHLNRSERRVIECAAVVGEVFEWGAVAELVPAELRPDLGGNLMSLVRKEVIRPAPSDLSDDDAFRFRHLLIRDAAYEGMAKETRSELHERFARWLEGAGARASARDAGDRRLPLGASLALPGRARGIRRRMGRSRAGGCSPPRRGGPSFTRSG